MNLTGKVVVITGASSGIGRAGAIAFARKGCSLVLAARRADALEATAPLCRQAGGRALVVVTDVTKEDDVARLASEAMGVTGRIDVWVNNAGVTLFSLLEDAPFEEHRRVLETNLHGAMHGARAVVPIFRRQKHGVLINVGSVLSKIGQPFVPSYVISKFALRGMTEALRSDLADEPDVHVCTLMPYAVDTQHFESAANRIGHPARAMPPVQSPEKVAAAMVDLARRPRRELHVPRVAALGLVFHFLTPRFAERLLNHALREWHFGPSRQPPTKGNLYAPPSEPAYAHGTRPPRLGAPALALWAARESVVLQVESARRVVGRLGRKRD